MIHLRRTMSPPCVCSWYGRPSRHGQGISRREYLNAVVLMIGQAECFVTGRGIHMQDPASSITGVIPLKSLPGVSNLLGVQLGLLLATASLTTGGASGLYLTLL